MSHGLSAKNNKKRDRTIAIRTLLAIAGTVFTCSLPLTGFADAEAVADTPSFDLTANDQLQAPKQDALTTTIREANDGPIWHVYPVAENDSIWTLFKNEGLSEFDLIDLFDVDGSVAYLSRLGRVKSVRYQIDDSGRLNALNLPLISGENVLFERSNQTFIMSVTGHENGRTQEPELTQVSGQITSSLYRSGRDAGLNASTIMQFANIFQWQVDFSRDIRQGDRFELLLEKPADNSQGSATGIIAARFYQKDRTLTALMNDDGQYYTPEGKLLGSTFARYPLGQPERVSSHYSLKRVHPITGVVKPHRGTDWAVPVGTPVYAPADGIVSEAVLGHPAAGHYIELRNGRRYVTRYLHLDSLNVEPGQLVKKGDLIGRTGNTGLSTGPHLHYELYVNGRPVDPMTVKLPESRQLTGTELARFKKENRLILARLDQDSSQMLARAPVDNKKL